ncbi:hypothetical protein HYT52_03905 [Candidatus Woesearchaeota archaeon]|nr:hypothetical protein [Candidatus Woesearchaeota archaeon]
MSEKFLVIDHLKISYTGLFNAAELYNLISSWFFGKGWDWHEKVNMERITPDGKQIHQIFWPWKSVSNFYKIIMHIRVNMIDVKDVEVEKDGKKIRVNQGEVHITIDGYVLADRNDYWTDKPFTWWFTVMAQKYFFKSHYQKIETWIKGDVEDLNSRIKRYLNMFRYSYQA